MTRTIEDYLRLTVGDLRRAGYLKANGTFEGVLRWTRRGEQVAATNLRVHISTDVAYMALAYDYKGATVNTEITLRFKPSNLNNGAGYYYFVCPVTGLSCRNLYLYNGRFVSRAAFRPLYRKQTETHSRRVGYIALIDTFAKYDELQAQKYRRLTYRGKPTPWGRKVAKLGAKCDYIADKYMLQNGVVF